jgi:hypothetical protein
MLVERFFWYLCSFLRLKCVKNCPKGPSTLAFFASVSPSAMAPPPNCFLCIITYVIAREKQRKQLGGGAITEGETDAKHASLDGPLAIAEGKNKYHAFFHIMNWITDIKKRQWIPLRTFLVSKGGWIRFSVCDCTNFDLADVTTQS